MKQLLLTVLVILLIDQGLQAQQMSRLENPGHLNIKASMYGIKTNGEDPGVKDYDFYMKRSRNQRIVGWSTLGAGLLLSAVGLLVATNSSDDIYDDSDETTAGVLLATGAASGIVSIPFMIMASVNKHKAKVMLNNQKTGFGVPPNVSKNIPGISLAIPIGQ
jgi:hypothetical protein